MQTLEDLLSSVEGLSFLEAEGVLVASEEFKVQLKMPVRPELARALSVGEKKLICSGQQIYVDYRQSVVSKIEILRALERDDDLFPFFLWVDTDRSGSDNLMTKFAWPNSGKKGPITILPPGAGEVELRFAVVDTSQVSRAIDRLETELRQSGDHRNGAKKKYQDLRTVLANGGKKTALSEFNLRVTDFLLANVLGYIPRSLILSDVLSTGWLSDGINLFLNRIADVIRVFNEKRGYLERKGIDPQVRPLDEHYLPLFYSCEVDHQRLRLQHSTRGSDHFAVGACKCGQEYRFHLGEKTLSVTEIAQTGLWSLDVCFPLFLNDLVSGFVAGKSSALYLIVMNEVLRKVLGAAPVPMLVPQTLQKVGNGNSQVDSLLYRYFAGSP